MCEFQFRHIRSFRYGGVYRSRNIVHIYIIYRVCHFFLYSFLLLFTTASYAENAPSPHPKIIPPHFVAALLFFAINSTVQADAKIDVVRCRNPFPVSPLKNCPVPGRSNDASPFNIEPPVIPPFFSCGSAFLNSTISVCGDCTGFVPGGKIEAGEKPSYCFVSEVPPPRYRNCGA